MVMVATTVLVLPPAEAVPSAAMPTIAWSPCGEDWLGEGFECGTLATPLDRDGLSEENVSLAVARHRSTGSAAERVGSLVIGTGGAGRDVMAQAWYSLPAEITKRFDVVSWDARGWGASTPRLKGCVFAQPNLPSTGRVNWRVAIRDLLVKQSGANVACQKANGDLLRHLGTIESAYDLYALREALGDERLSFWGWGWGSRVGSVYATWFPDRVAALVFDGSVDPTGTLLTWAQAGPQAELAFPVFAHFYPTAARQFTQVLQALDRHTVRLTNTQVLTRWDALNRVYGGIGWQAAYASTAEDIGTLHTAVLGSGPKARAARTIVSMWKEQAAAVSRTTGAAAIAMQCTDFAGRPTTTQVVAASLPSRRVAPRLGPIRSAALAGMCAGFTYAPDPVPQLTTPNPEAAVMIAAATRDVTLPFAWSESMLTAFPSGGVVVYVGTQSPSWGLAGSECVDTPLTAFMLTGATGEATCANAYVKPGGVAGTQFAVPS